MIIFFALEYYRIQDSTRRALADLCPQYALLLRQKCSQFRAVFWKIWVKSYVSTPTPVGFPFPKKLNVNVKKKKDCEHQDSLADLGGARPAHAPPFAWHPSSLADLGGACPVHAPPFAWHPSF